MRNRNRILTFLLSLIMATAGTASMAVRAQTDQTADGLTQFNAKADKLLRYVYQRASEAETAPATRRAAAAADVDKLSRVTTLSRSPQGGVSVGVLVQLTSHDAAELKNAGFGVGAVVGDIATVETDASALPDLASLSSVKRMWAGTYRRPVNDRARQGVGIDNASGQRVVSQTGAGVVVGIIDSGIDFRHKDFTVPGSNGTQTRIKYLLDMTGGPSSWDFTLPGGTAPIGKLYTQANINAALAVPKPAQSADTVKERDKNGHGTHVAGIAAGNGLAAPTAPGVYAGMAPAADLIIVKASRQDDGKASFRDDDEINALQFIQTKAAELGEPFVINMSLGGQLGPHDGTGPDERVIDQMVSGGPGRAVCVAAGNEGSDSIHALTTVPAGGSISLDFSATTNPQFIDLYYKNTDRFRVTVTKPDGTSLGPVSFSANGFASNNGQLSDSTVQIWNALDDKGDSDPSNDQPDIFIVFKSGAPTGTWHFIIQDADATANSPLDAWATGDTVSFTDFVDNNSHLVASPGTARGAITVGAFVTRSASQTIGNFAFFTSPGPTADGRQKPEISAPGYYLYSTRGSDILDTSIFTYGSPPNALASGVDQTLYGGLAGTSMSTPVVTGSVALLIQANPSLTTDQIKTFIENNATHDQFDPAGWNPRFGFGKLNIAAAINAAVPQTNPIDTTDFFVKQHYLDFLNRTADSSGLAFWSNNIDSCGADAQCRDVKRIDTSAAFFLSIEFQETGYFVYKTYKAAFGNINPPAVPVPVRRATFLADSQKIASTPAQVIVGQPGWDTQLSTNKTAYEQGFVQRSDFLAKYPLGMAAGTYVDTLFATAGVTPTATERGNAVAAYGAGDTAGRAAALRSVVESNTLHQSELNRAFVLMQYFGYLQRDPDSGPDTNFDGYNFWLNKLNSFGGDYRAAEMVKAFLASTEYRHRFGS